eukprot:CAMPEP_0167764990 /NCGR_PEP_ID=MMETSP0110_2-20121227/14403_1 /TAXON_ID=629695 /ORGANISM="Gymnochlora sp., Strain CCMP2014" /LENGTH=57 /DNA_ID=CAMNT_0007652583 /DNA_START=108 /DNA_END=277 /DNA_ORIENTATION=-
MKLIRSKLSEITSHMDRIDVKGPDQDFRWPLCDEDKEDIDDKLRSMEASALEILEDL